MKLLLAGHYQFGEFHGSAFIAYPIYRVFAGQIHAYALVLTRALPSIIAPSLFVALVAIGAAALAIAIADRYTARIAKTLSALVTAADEIAAGHLDVDLGTEEPRERELRDLKIALAQMASALKDLDDKQSAFLLSISHDLKTPLTSIRGFAEAIIDNAVSDPTVAARTIVSESSRIERLINDLIALARMRAPDFTVTATEVDLHELIGRLVESAQPTLQNAALELEFRSQSGSIPVMTDPQRLLQLLGNLVDNAIKYASTKVVISLTEEPTVVIEDDGPGIPPDIADSIFKEQVTPSPGRQGQIGSGLGLLIVFRLSQLLGLSISCQSPLDSSGGSRFTLRFR
jgi:two-component system sensor histidine kinase BaeS